MALSGNGVLSVSMVPGRAHVTSEHVHGRGRNGKRETPPDQDDKSTDPPTPTTPEANQASLTSFELDFM